MTKKSFYEILGVENNAKPSEIKMAFRKLESQHQPSIEKNSRRKKSDKEFLVIKEAYETLINEASRKQYDAKLQEELDQAAGSSVSEQGSGNNASQSNAIVIDFSKLYEKFELLANQYGLQILWKSVLGPVKYLFIFLAVMFFINNFQECSYKYTLVSTVLEDTVYYTQTRDGKRANTVEKGEVVEVVSSKANGKFIETNLGKLPKDNLSSPKNGYIMRGWASAYQALFPLLMVIVINLILLRIIGAMRGINVSRKYNQTHDEELSYHNILYCIKNEATILQSLLTLPVAFLITFLVRQQLDALVLSYAFSEGDNGLLNALLASYQTYHNYFIFTIILLTDICVGYLLILWLFHKYTCPHCHAPFSFFIVKRYDTDINTFNKTEYRNEQRNGINVKVPYIVAYKNYNHHIIKRCDICEEGEHTVQERTEKM